MQILYQFPVLTSNNLRAAADATQGKAVAVSAGADGPSAVDSTSRPCAALKPVSVGSSPWLTVDLGYVGDIAAVGITLGAADLTAVNLRAGSKVSCRHSLTVLGMRLDVGIYD